jgi:hypothetical protein
MHDAFTLDDDIYVVGELAFRYRDGRWTDLDKQYITRLPAYGIHGRRRDDIYAVGQQMVLHYDGTSWEWINSGLERNLRSVWVESDGNVIAVGSGPVLVEFDGEQWSSREIHIPTVESYGFNDVVGIGSTVFVVGDEGLLGMRKGREWYFMQPTGASLTAIWGSDENHVYVATTADNRLLFYNGTRWDMITIEGPQLDAAVSIWGTSPSNMFVLDRWGSLARFNGREWTAETHLLSDMSSVAGNGREFLVVGYLGAVSYRK